MGSIAYVDKRDMKTVDECLNSIQHTIAVCIRDNRKPTVDQMNAMLFDIIAARGITHRYRDDL